MLGLDPIGQGERNQLPDLDGPLGNGTAGTEHYGCSFEHEYVQRQAALLGVNAASAWLWDLIRLVDFVVADPRIDGALYLISDILQDLLYSLERSEEVSDKLRCLFLLYNSQDERFKDAVANLELNS